MQHPGDWLRAVAVRWCSEATMANVMYPLLADLRLEHQDAVERGQTLKAWWIRVAGLIAFLKVLALCGWERAMRPGWTSNDRSILRRIVGVSLAAMVVVTAVLLLPPLRVLHSHRFQMADALRMFVYLIPQGLGVAVPIGCMCGMLFGLRGSSVSRRSVAGALAFVTLAALCQFVMLAWIVPASNQTFRIVTARAVWAIPDSRPPMKGLNELTLGELRQQMRARCGWVAGECAGGRNLAFTYHERWSLSAATLVLSLFAASLSALISASQSGPSAAWQRRSISAGRIVRFTCGAIGVFGYYALMYCGRSAALVGAASPFAGAWLPNLVGMLLSLLFMRIWWLRSRARLAD
jgi:lipopolysaccharide export LptBFGC system permease protein LptF